MLYWHAREIEFRCYTNSIWFGILESGSPHFLSYLQFVISLVHTPGTFAMVVTLKNWIKCAVNDSKITKLNCGGCCGDFVINIKNLQCEFHKFTMQVFKGLWPYLQFRHLDYSSNFVVTRCDQLLQIVAWGSRHAHLSQELRDLIRIIYFL